MGRGATGTVEPLKTAIRLKFTWRGSRRVETLDLEPTPANIKAATRLMATIQAEIKAGIFDYDRHFPKEGTVSTASTFRDYSARWLETFVGAKSTKRSYRTALNATWNPAFGDKMLPEILYSDAKAAIAAKSAGGASGKTINNHLVPARDVFRMAVRDGLIAVSPMDGIANLAHQAPEPDPFDHDEVAALLSHMETKFPEQVANYFEFALQTGMRPSEIIALQWGDVAWNKKRIKVQRAVVDWEPKGTKTNKVREVDLSGDALAVLKRQKAHTFMRGTSAEIFNNPNTLKPWADEQVQRRRYFAPALRALGLRERDAYQCRHTFASLALMGGINIGYLSRQLGHATITTTLTKYARWIEGADKGSEAAKMDAIMSRNRPRKSGTD